MIIIFCQLSDSVSLNLFQVTKNADAESLRNLIEKYTNEGRSLRPCDRRGWQAVHYASEYEDTKLLKMLLDADPDLVGSMTHENATPLIVAAGVGNLNGVKVLLPLMDESSLQQQTIHGMNALNYAVQCENPDFEVIASLLIEKCCLIEFISNMSSYESVPFRVVKRKSGALLRGLLCAGLSTEYCVQTDFVDEDHNLNSSIVYPFNLASYCVSVGWHQGLKMLIDVHKSRQEGISEDAADAADGGSYSTCVQSNVQEMLLASHHHNLRVLASAWHMAFYVGSRECVDLMVKCGLKLTTWCNHEQTPELSESLPLLPLAVTFQGDLWEKRDFIRYVLQLQSLDVYEKTIKDHLLAVFEDNEVSNRDLALDNHALNTCLISVFKAAQSTKLNHSVEQTLDMLTQHCGFTFCFEIIPDTVLLGKLRFLPVCEYLLMLYRSTGTDRLYMYRYVIVFLLNQATHLSVSSRTVALSAQIETNLDMYCLDGHKADLHAQTGSIHTTAINLLVLKHLIRLPIRQVMDELNRLHIVNNEIVYRHPTDDIEMNVKAVICPPAVFQCLVKGIRPVMDSDRTPMLVLFPQVAFFRYGRIRDSWLKKIFVLSYHNLEKYKKTELPSLQQLCRFVIRESLGPWRLLHEPVPRAAHKVEYERDITWEVSYIEQLPGLPNILKDYLRFKPEWADYVQYGYRLRASLM